MPKFAESTLSVIPSSNEGERLLVVLLKWEGESRLELRQQTWGEGIGWFTQNSVPVEPHQLAQLRTTLGGPATDSQTATVRFSSAAACTESTSPRLRIHAESA